jgi:hypothetical protein
LTLACCGGLARAAEIEGEYLEARTADVFTGPCFSNSEIFTTGHQAVMAWGIRKGGWNGVDLAGLNVAAAVRGTSTFSQDVPAAALSVVIVDDRATPEQREALVAFARHLAGERLSDVVAVRPARMTLMVETHEAAATNVTTAKHELHPHVPQAPKASFWAAGLAEIVTRPLDDNDHFCGNETVAYEPLSRGVSVKPAYTLGHRFRGEGLNTTWNDPNCRSSFVGTFSY